MVDGLSYGDEKRFLLGTDSGALRPLPLDWAITVSGIFSGPILVASGK